ncbi:MAG: (d)CMP kinase, partial [Anaerococcus vaginalis]|nr:(d)CMP kinase [Anaerococcus vaginalis]
LLADKLKISYLNTGSMYRALTLYFLENNIKKSENIDIKILKKINIDINEDKVFLNGKDVSQEIRDKEVTENVSWVSSIPVVREYLVEMQRKISKNKSIILDGRDIGTVVFPDAKYKFYLDASSFVRAKRRFEQNEIDKSSAKTLIDNGVIAVGEGANMPSTLEAQKLFVDNKILDINSIK